MRISRLVIPLALGALGAIGLPAASALAVNTSNIVFNDIPQTHQTIACNAGRTAALSFIKVQFIENNCEFRMWLHQNADGSGVAECFDPHSTENASRTQNYRQVQVTSNTAACP